MTSDADAKKLSFGSVFLLGVNSVIGSGAFLLIQTIYGFMDLTSVLVIVAAAVAVTMVALCFADLASRFTGPDAAWISSAKAFGKFTGYEVGIFIWFLGTCTIAAESVAFFITLGGFFPVFRNSTVAMWSAIALIVLFGIINLFGDTLVTWVNNTSSTAKIAIIVLFIIVGAFFLHKQNFTPVIPAAATSAGGFFHHFGEAFADVFYMYTGFNFIPIMASKMNRPEKNVPRVLIAVMITCTVLYSLMALFAIGIVGPSIVNYDLPVAIAFKEAVGEWGYIVIALGMLISIFGVGFSISFSSPLNLASLAARRHRFLPSGLTKTNKYGCPWAAVAVTIIVACFLATQSYDNLVNMLVFASFVQYVPSIISVICFKHTGKCPGNGFKLPGGYTFPILALIVSAYMMFQFTLETFAIGVCVAVIAGIVYYINKPSKRTVAVLQTAGVDVENPKAIKAYKNELKSKGSSLSEIVKAYKKEGDKVVPSASWVVSGGQNPNDDAETAE
ncbi:MAG: APC family permease [Bifidobacteriaceae bacterium]|nr:APC family permease [Bifidobacteriaceae bacterium]